MKTQKTMTKNLITLAVAVAFALFSIMWIIGPSGASQTNATPENPPSQENGTTSPQDETDDEFFQTDDTGKFTSIYIDEKNPNFRNSPYFTSTGSESVLMVPAGEFLDSIGARVTYYAGGSTVAGYRQNAFIKMVDDSEYGYLNGLKRPLEVRTEMKDGALFVPVTLFSHAFDYVIKEKESKVYLKSRARADSFTKFGEIYYRSATLNGLDASLSIPDYWRAIDKKSNYFGYTENGEEQTLNVYSYYSSAGSARDAGSEFIARTLGDKYEITSKSQAASSQGDSYRIEAVSAGNAKIAKAPRYVYYLVKSGKRVYVLSFYTNNKLDLDEYMSTFKNVFSTLRLETSSIDYSKEYYTETPSFFSRGFSVSDGVRGGLIAFSSFQFSGKSGSLGPGEKLVAVVEKGTSTSWFRIPAGENGFDSPVYLPFGLGKHNITISVVPSGASSDSVVSLARESSRKVMEFSAINTNPEPSTYMVPSTYIDSDDKQIISVANIRSYNELKAIDKARSLYRYVAENFKLEKSSLLNPASVTLKNKSGSPKEMALLYAALLRSVSIPSRVASYTYAGATGYCTEMKVNGTWLIADPGRAASDYSRGRIETYGSYFAMPFSDFYEGKKNIARLSY